MSCHPQSLQHPKSTELMDVQSLDHETNVDDVPVLLPSIPGLSSNIQQSLNCMVICLIFRFSDQLSASVQSHLSRVVVPRSRILRGQLGGGSNWMALMELSGRSDQSIRSCGDGSESNMIQHDPTWSNTPQSWAVLLKHHHVFLGCPVLIHINPYHN